MGKGSVRLLQKLFLLLSPLLCLLVYYVIADPFKVLYHYNSYFDSGEAPIVYLDKDFVSTETFINNYKQVHYDSYIFGSSRSMFYRIDDWKRYIHSDKCFHFDASEESLYGVYLKLKFLGEKGGVIKNALIIMDAFLLSDTTDTYKNAHLYAKDPVLSGASHVKFQYQFLKAFFDAHFLFPYLIYKISGKVNNAYSHTLDEDVLGYDKITNEVQLLHCDSLIQKDPRLYYDTRSHLFRHRDTLTKVTGRCIFGNQKRLLEETYRILQKHGTRYKIIISPSYSQVKFSPVDLAYLEQLFGHNNVFDFSGKNKLSENVRNFYDESHYRPNVCKYIMSVAYSNDTLHVLD